MSEHAEAADVDPIEVLAPPIEVVVVDDHEMLLDSLVRVLDQELDMRVVASATSIADGLAVIAELRPDVVIMDFQMPDGDGSAAAQRIVERWPETRVIMLTGSNAIGAVFEAARAGCSGFLDKTRAMNQLAPMVRSVHAGGIELPMEQLDQLPHVDDLVVHYQPLVDLETAAIVGFEALVRWDHPTRGLVLPDDFIPLAEQTSRILDIDSRVRRDACIQAATWHRDYPTTAPRVMSVNLSGRELRIPDLPSQIGRMLDETGIDPASFMIEITETFLVGDADDTTRRLEELKHLGLRIALDDFGTGYSSLGYLRRFPIDVIKLDKSFTDELPHGERGLRLVESLGRLAQDMDAVAEAEGIETTEQVACLRSLGWGLGQGYYFSRAVDADAIEVLLDAGAASPG